METIKIIIKMKIVTVLMIIMTIMKTRSAVRNPLAGKRALRLPLASHHTVL